jgi:hypothetical protein
VLSSRRWIARTVALAVMAGGWLGGAAAGATTFSFGLPGTGLPSQTTSYLNVATLTLTQTADGVQFVLDPNESNPGFGSKSSIKRLDFVYAGAILDQNDFRIDDGVSGRFSFQRKHPGMDAGYRANDFHITVKFPSKSKNRFDPSETSTWTILGTTLDDFASFATAKNKPDPVFSVISLSGYFLRNAKPSSSNWVAPVPEPGTAALLLVGLGGLAAVGRQRDVAAPRS